MPEDSKKAKIRLDLSVDVDSYTCELIRKSLNPDNDPNIEMECSSGKFSVNVINLKISSLYNITDDILRCYEVSKKIVDDRD